MPANDSWVYQGRQYHMLFGDGTKPHVERAPPPGQSKPSLADRIRSVGLGLVAALPASKRSHAVARLDSADQARLARAMTGLVRALPLGPRLAPLRVLGKTADGPGIAAFVQAAAAIDEAGSHADLRQATDLLGQSAQEMGLDHFRPFLRDADDHLTQTGGLVALLQDLPKPAPTVAPPVLRPSMQPRMPPPGLSGPLLRGVLQKAGWVGLAVTLLDGLIAAHRESEIAAAIQRFQ